MIAIPFDPRGALVACAFFLGLLLLFAVAFLVNLRHERLGRFELSRRTRILGFLTTAALYAAVIYGWLFWRTFYELRIEPAADRLEMTVLMPERRLEWPLARIASIQEVSGSRAGFARLQVETRDGRRYVSPNRRTAEISAIYERLETSLAGSPLVRQGEGPQR
jgi:hypothetical protein